MTNGIATFSGLSLDKHGTAYRLTASSSTLTSANSTLFIAYATAYSPTMGQVALWGLFGSFVALFVLLAWKREGQRTTPMK
jgi:hypothetical protein